MPKYMRSSALGALLGAFNKNLSDIEYVAISCAAGATQELKAAAAGYKVCLLGIQVTMSVAGTLTIEDTAGTDLSGAMPLAANGGIVLQPGNFPYTITPADLGLRVAPATGNLRGMAQILKVAV